MSWLREKSFRDWLLTPKLYRMYRRLGWSRGQAVEFSLRASDIHIREP